MRILMIILTAVVWFPSVALGQNVLIPVQGTLAAADGTPINGVVSIELGLYEEDFGGTPIWSEVRDLTVRRGYFTVFAGDITPLDATVFRDHSLLIFSFSVEGEESRFQLGAVPTAAFAHHAAEAAHAESAQFADDAATLEGRASSDFAAVDHSHTLDCTTVVSTVTVVPGTTSVAEATCPRGYVPTGGGFDTTWGSSTASRSRPNSAGNGWACGLRNNTTAHRDEHCYAICCRIAP